MSTTQRLGLYYPYLHFPDDWLKVAALYWPRMGRIVPESVELWLRDSDTVQALSDELDFTINVDPWEATGELIEVLIETLESHGDELRAKYAVSPKNSFTSNWCDPTWPQPQRLASHWSNQNSHELQVAARAVLIHMNKGEEWFWQLLSDAGLATEKGHWWGLHPELAWLYMCTLADKLARQNQLVPTTDQYIAHIESLGWTDELFAAALLGHDPQTVAAAEGGWSQQLGLLALRLVIPSDLHTVPVRKIVQVRQRYSADFDAFYDEISDLATSLQKELTEIKDPAVLSAYLDNEMQRRFARPLTTLQGAMRGIGIDTTLAAVTTKFELPTSAAVLGGLLTHHPAIAAEGAIAFGTASLLRSYRQSRGQIEPSTASYLWRVERAVSPSGLLTRVLRSLSS